MDEWIQRFAKDLGAQIIAEIPKGEFGPVGAAQTAGFYSRRMEEIRRKEAVHKPPTEAMAIPLDESTYQALQTAAEMLWPHEKTDAAKFGGRLLKGLAVLILEQLMRRLDEKKQALRKTIDGKDAITAALKELLEGAPNHAAAG